MIRTTVLVVEDNTIEAKSLISLLMDLGYQVIGTARNTTEAIQLFENKHPDIVLLDIELGNDELGGIKVAEYIQGSSQKPILIYLTQFSDSRTITFATKTFPSAYLAKPYSEKQLGVTILMGVQKKSLWNSNSDDILAFTGKLFIPQAKLNSPSKAISILNILYFQADGAYCNIFLTNGSKLRISKNLRVVTEKLPSAYFLRVHKKYTVNLSRITEVLKNPQEVVLDDSIKLSIGETHSKNFFEWHRGVKP